MLDLKGASVWGWRRFWDQVGKTCTQVILERRMG